MNNTSTKKSPLTQLIYRPLWITAACLLFILSVALFLLINTSWRALHRVEPLKEHLFLIEEIQQSNAEVDRMLLATKTDTSEHLLAQFTQLQQTLTHTLKISSGILSEEARTALLQARNILQEMNLDSADKLSLVREKLRTALHSEINTQSQLLHLLARDNRIELETATSIAIVLPLLGLFILFFLRHRILKPLNGLAVLLNQLGRQSIPPVIPLEEEHSLLRPLFINFNQLVQRLSELERAQSMQQLTLEDNVRIATQSLLEHHRTLAQSERLAVIGELTAGLAHELRNPLAGIYLALNNLRSEIEDSDKVSRLTMVLEELNRVTALLNQVLNQARHSPEVASHFNLAGMLASLLRLIRYQVPSQIKIELQVSKNIQCYLPQGRLRQIMLNLILNAAQSIYQKPGLILITAQAEGSQIVISIQDNGPGFPERLLASGVQPFITSKEGGTGLGLAIVRRFCYEQGGTLELANLPEGGAHVQVTLERGG